MEWKITEQGPRVIVEVWRNPQPEGLYKAYLCGTGGRCLLGTLMPENGRLFLRRTMTLDSLKRQGIWPPQGVEEEVVRTAQRQSASIDWKDPVLRRSARNLPRHTVSRNDVGFVMKMNYDPREPFPLLPAFCFARWERGQLIFCFDRDGFPYIS